jgi:endonuclease YncB( thermonuclease family)
MKKLLLLTSLFIVGCAPVSAPTIDPSIEPSVPSTSTPDVENEQLFISEVYASNESTFGKAIEIGYLGTDNKCLDGYVLNIYSGKTLKKSITFTSNDYIDENRTYVIANKTNDVYDYHSKADMILDDDYIFGSNKIELVSPKGNMFETFGSELKYDYALYSSHLKLPVFYGPSTAKYDLLKYINVRVDENYSYLGNLECPFENQQDILKGPKITEELFAKPFETGSAPGGGFAEVTLQSCGDGDTTVFRFKDSYVNVESSERTRYMNINTPEISHSPDGSGEEPWGEAAKSYNNQILRGAKKILVQSVLGYGFRETYGRLLGFVWYSNVENPTLSDYKLLNVEMVKEGYAYFGGSDPLKQLYSENIYYNTYFEYAYLYAQNSKIRIHGEIDPDFDY